MVEEVWMRTLMCLNELMLRTSSPTGNSTYEATSGRLQGE